MARSTAQVVGPKADDKCHDCNVRAEATATNGAVTLRACAIHSERYLKMAKYNVVVTFDEDANIAACPTCRRVIGHGGRAAHRCEER